METTVKVTKLKLRRCLYRLAGAALFAAFFAMACRGEDITSSRCTLELPELPAAWAALPGEFRWQIQWLDQDQRKQTKIVGKGERPELEPHPTLVSAVAAWPYWPDIGIGAGVFKPAGALFPYDFSGGRLRLDWNGGLDAALFWELAAAAGSTVSTAKTPRLPQNFNWPRFRELFSQGEINAELCRDPWLADWSLIAQKTVQSGFDKRRLVVEARETIPIPVPAGVWTGTSPFAPSLYFEEGKECRFPVRLTAADIWVSPAGILNCDAKTWIFRPW